MRGPGTTEPRGRSWRGEAPECLYLWLAIPFGLVFAFFNPPFRGVPDELAHYWKALALAQGEPGAQGRAPRNYVELSSALAPETEGRRRDAKVDRAKLAANLTGGPSAEEVEFTTRVGYAYPFGYVPQAAGLWLGLQLRAPPLVAFWLGRLLTLAVAVAGVYLAIRVAPFGKRVFLLLGLLPGTVQQMASFSYDALHIAGLLLFTAYVLGLAGRPRPLTVAERAKAFALSLTSSLTKPGYAAMALLVFLLPRRLFRTPRSHAWFTGSAVFANLVLLWLVQVLLDEGSAQAHTVDPKAQLEHVRAHPLAFSTTLARTILERGATFWKNLVLPSAANVDLLSPWLYLFTGLGLVLCLRSQDEVVRLSRAQRAVLLATGLMQALLVLLSLYLISTPVAQGIVLGFQGRYFLVVLPVLVLAFQGSGFGWRSEWIRRHPRAALLAFALVALGYVVLRLGSHYY